MTDVGASWLVKEVWDCELVLTNELFIVWLVLDVREGMRACMFMS